MSSAEHTLLTKSLSQEEAEKKIEAWLAEDSTRAVSLASVWVRSNLHTFHIPGEVTTEHIKVFLERGGLLRLNPEQREFPKDLWPYDTSPI